MDITYCCVNGSAMVKLVSGAGTQMEDDHKAVGLSQTNHTEIA
jgi:hypothetical protein